MWLTDSAGALLSRSIGDAYGHYAVMRFTASARLHVIHIGYRPRDIAISRSLADSIVNVKLEPIPATLSAVETSARRVCPGEADNGNALELWEQARAALTASVVARESNVPTLQMISFERNLDPITKRVRSHNSETKQIVADRSYVAGRPAWAFAAEGYMTEAPGAGRTFYAPNEDVLLDPSFVATHCLHLVVGGTAGTGVSHSDDVGIAFDPIEDDKRGDIVEVRGTLWIDRYRFELRSLEFTYTRLERAADRSDGMVTFQVMPSGAPMVKDWRIRSTAIAVDVPMRPETIRRREPDRADRTNVRTIGYREEGGVVAAATWADGTHWRGNLPRVVGVVADMKGTPAPRAKVWIRGTRDTVTTRDDGSFELPFVLPGIYTIVASDSTLGAQGISRTIPRIAALTNLTSTDSRVQLELHPRSEVLPTVCPNKSYKEHTGVVLVHVVDASGEDVENPRIDIETRQAIVAGDTVTRAVTRHADGDDEGHFHICGAALDQPMLIHATKDRATASALIEHWTDEVVAITLILRP